MYDEEINDIVTLVEWFERRVEVNENNYEVLAGLANRWDIPILLREIEVAFIHGRSWQKYYLLVDHQPSLNLWLFANQHNLFKLVEKCHESIQVQLQFMQKMIQDGALEFFLERRVEYKVIEDMLNIVWEGKRSGNRMREEKDRIAAATLERLIAVIDDEEEY